MIDKAENMRILNDDSATITQVISAVQNLEQFKLSNQSKIGISSSVTMNHLDICLKKQGLLENTEIQIIMGNYDDPIGDMELFNQYKVDIAVVVPFFDNLLPHFESQLTNLDEEVIAAKENEFIERYRLALQRASKIDLVILVEMHRITEGICIESDDISQVVLRRFNEALRKEAKNLSNVRVISVQDIIEKYGQVNCCDLRFYYRNKAPYTYKFFNALAKKISYVTRNFRTKYFKALIVDCDNTLWGGIIGEDLLAGIKLSKYDYPGNIFWQIQHQILRLEASGILICLASKNNLGDVNEVLLNHPDAVLRDKHIAAKKINWNDKVSNIKELANELNIGLDSMIFLDDSPFECESVRQQLPMVRTFQVPENLATYSNVIEEIKNLFLAGGISTESKSKTLQYRNRSQAESLKSGLGSQEEYLTSLQLKVEITRNDLKSIPRISELSMKSNQFNLTTKRYSQAEILSMMGSENHAVYSIRVRDKFGDAGLTGVVILSYCEGKAFVENFFMSCRVIGRGVEMVFWGIIDSEASMKGCYELLTEYKLSEKNKLVQDFYDRLGLTCVEQSEINKRYVKPNKNFVFEKTPWIELSYVG